MLLARREKFLYKGWPFVLIADGEPHIVTVYMDSLSFSSDLSGRRLAVKSMFMICHQGVCPLLP